MVSTDNTGTTVATKLTKSVIRTLNGEREAKLGRLYQKAGEQELAAAAFEETRRLQNKH